MVGAVVFFPGRLFFGGMLLFRGMLFFGEPEQRAAVISTLYDPEVLAMYMESVLLVDEPLEIHL